MASLKTSSFSIGFIFLLLLTGCKTNEFKTITFAFLTDLHVSPGSPNEGHLKKVVEEINGSDVELVIVTGDISDTGSDAELLTVKAILDSLSKPYLIIPGNHETNWSESAGLKMTELWGNDRFITEWNDFILVGFNTGPYMKMGDGHIKQEDLQWLKNELDLKVGPGKQLLAFAHYPLADGLDNWFEATDLLKKHHCRAAFCGHGHRLGLHNFDSIPGIMGRSLVLKDPNIPGYNIVQLKNDSLFVFEKIVGKPAQEAAITLSLSQPHQLQPLPLSPRPNLSINEQFPQAEESYQWSDTASIFTGVALSGDSLFVYGNSLGWLKAINHKKNKIIWETRFQGPIFSTPAIDNNMVVFGAIDGSIYGVDLTTGKIKWQVVTGNPVLATPMIHNNRVYIGGGKEAFYCINVSTGEIIWTFDDVEGLIQGIPAINSDHVVFGAWDRHLYNISAATGKLRWKWNNGRSNVLFSPGNIAPVISYNKVFLVAPDRYMTTLELTTGQQIWRTNHHQVRESMGVSPDGTEIYAKLMNDSIVSVSAAGKTFSTNWSVDAGIGYDHNPCPLIANNRWVIGATKNGLITAIDRDTHLVAWMHKIGNSSINLLSFDENDDLWVSSMEGRITKVEIKN